MDPWTAPADPGDELGTSLRTFVRVYDQRKDDVHGAVERFLLAAAQLKRSQEAAENPVVGVLSSAVGGAVGAVLGGVTGGLWGAVGAVGAVTCGRFCGDIGAVSATVGLAGAVVGGVVGGALSGAIGSTVEIVAEAQGSPLHGVVSSVLWFAVGITTGGAIGGTVGGSVGAVGGAMGGGFGALHATTALNYLLQIIIDQPAKLEEKKSTVQEAGADLREHINPLVKELETVAGNMAAGDAMTTAAKTLAAVTATEKSVSDSLAAKNVKRLTSCVQEAEQRCREIPDGLEATREEAEKVLVSLK